MTSAAAAFSGSMNAWNADQGNADLAAAAQKAYNNLVDLVHQAENAVEVLVNKGIDAVDLEAVVSALVKFIASVTLEAWVWATVGVLVWKGLPSVLNWISSIWNWFGSPSSSGGSGNPPASSITASTSSSLSSSATCSGTGSACGLCTLPTATPLPDLPAEDVLSQTDPDFPLFLRSSDTAARRLKVRDPDPLP